MRRKPQKYIWYILAVSALFAMLVGVQVRAMILKNYAPLSGVVIFVDPGHGGKDSGARADGVNEQDINLAISMKLKEHLEQAGASITLTRDGAYDLAEDTSQNRKRDDMRKRVELINQEETDLFLSIHLNAYPNKAIHGAQAFYNKGDENSKIFADIIQSHLIELTNKKMQSKPGDYYILNKTKHTGALVECGFITNSEDRTKLMSDAYQEKVAITLYDSILEYLEILDI